jgi:transcriptional regulator GlxA family with amidase domain
MSGRRGWYRAMSDPGLRRVLEQVHAAPGRDWTVPAMASLAGLSRAAFAARFRQLIGQPPGRYLTELRMQRAEDALVRSKATLAEIAAAVGYQTNSLSRPRSAGTTRCLRANGVCRSSRDRPGRAAAR